MRMFPIGSDTRTLGSPVTEVVQHLGGGARE